MPDRFLGDAWVVIRPDISKFETELAAGLTNSLTQVQAMADAKPIHLRVDVDTSAAVAQITALQAAGAGIGGGGGGGRDGGGVVPVPTGGGGGGGGLLSTIGFGRAAGIAGMAGAFSLASFAGLGFEHVLTTAIGLAGSLAGAIGGGLLLAIGAAGVAAVGMGSDMAVMKSTITDTKTLYTALTALQQAIIQYGKGSTQAVAAQTALNVQIQMLGNTAGVAAELALAKSVQAMNAFWDKATSAARVGAVGILQQLVTVANVYIPLIAAAAERNFAIIGNAIKPLLAFLSGPATDIFKHLEDVFAKNLPTAIHAFTQGIELILKSINFLSNYTGGLTRAIDEFLTKANSPAGFLKWQGIMTTLIGMFHTWWDFVKELAKVLFDLFSQSLGLGTAIVKTITGMLVKLDAWLLSSSGKNAVHTLFAVHLQEVLALLALLPTLLSAFSHLYLTIAPALTVLVTGLALMVGWMVQVPVAGPMLAWGLAIAFLASKLKLLAIYGGIATMIELIGAAAGGASVGIGFLTVGVDGLAIGTLALTAPIAIIVAAIAALGVAAYLLIFHFKEVTAFMSTGWGKAFQIALAVVMPFIALPLEIILHWQAIGTFFHDLPGRIMEFLKPLPGRILTFFKDIPGALGNAAVWLLKTGGEFILGLLKGLAGALPTVLKFMVELPFQLLAQIVGAARWLWQTGTEILYGLWQGITTGATAVWKWFTSLPGTIWGLLTKAPSWLLQTGINIITGLVGGIKSSGPGLWKWFTDLPGTIAGLITGAGTWLYNIGKEIINGLLNGLKAAWQNVVNWFSSIPGDIAGFFKSALGIHSPSSVFHAIGVNIMEGLNRGLKAGIPGVMDTMNGLSGSLSGGMSVPGSLGAGGGLGLSSAGSFGSVGASRLAGGSSGPVSLTLHIHNNSGTVGETESIVRREFRSLVLALRAR
jgi:hypothetical protein